MSDNRYKIDLHSHSIISHDGGISKSDYKKILDDKVLDFIAVTDHNETSFARALQTQLGPQIIVGEEIKTLGGEIIGLYLTKTIESGKSALETVKEIHADGGIVYIPHPFEIGRASLQEDLLGSIIDEIDIIEVFNARGKYRGKYELAANFAQDKNLAQAASSDAHCKKGIGSAYSIINDIPNQKSLIRLLHESTLQKKYASFISLFCPGFYKIKNKLII